MLSELSLTPNSKNVFIELLSIAREENYTTINMRQSIYYTALAACVLSSEGLNVFAPLKPPSRSSVPPPSKGEFSGSAVMKTISIYRRA